MNTKTMICHRCGAFNPTTGLIDEKLCAGARILKDAYKNQGFICKCQRYEYNQQKGALNE